MSTANISDDIRVKFPLHSAVWENDYRKLEEQIRIPQVDDPLTDSSWTDDQKMLFASSLKAEGDVKSL